MFIRSLIAVSLSLFATMAPAQNLQSLAGQSEFINQHLDYLRRNNAKSVFGSTKSYCPSVYWWGVHTDSINGTRRLFKQDLSRQMKMSGFNDKEIDHCVANSGYLLRNGQLVDHPKHQSYKNYVQSAIMLVRNKSTGNTTDAPALVETHSYDDDEWSVFDRTFSRICTFVTPGSRSVEMNCKGYGKLKGRHIKEGSGRYTLIVENDKFQIAYMTRRPRKVARSRFAKLVN